MSLSQAHWWPLLLLPRSPELARHRLQHVKFVLPMSLTPALCWPLLLLPAALSWQDIVFTTWSGLRGSISLIMIAEFVTVTNFDTGTQLGEWPCVERLISGLSC